MIRALYSAASGMTAQQLNVDNIAHNLANANTAGYKARHAQFQDLLYQNLIQPGAAAGQQTTVPTGLQLGLGTRAASNEIIFTQGNFSQTDNPLDLVIQGKGFFQVRRASGEIAYTRAGSFHLDRDGSVVTQDGEMLEPQLTIPKEAQSVTIATDGTVSYLLPNQTQAQQAGQIQLAGLPESCWSEQHRPKLVYSHQRVWRCCYRRSRWSGRFGITSAGIHRAVECQRR